MSAWHDRVGDLTLLEALTGGAFDQNFSKKSNAPGFARGGMGGFGIDRYISYMLRNDVVWVLWPLIASLRVGSLVLIGYRGQRWGSRNRELVRRMGRGKVFSPYYSRRVRRFSVAFVPTQVSLLAGY